MPKNDVEALLFSAGKNMTVDVIAKILDCDKREVVKDLKALQQEYNTRDSALMIVDEGDLWKIHVREKHLSVVQKIISDTELPKTVLETLAIIAYKSPVLQSDVINLRTSTAYEHIGLLMDMGFVTREKSGRSFALKVTDKFFDYFDIAGDKTLQEIFKNVRKPKEKKNGQAAKEEQTTLDEELPKIEIVDEEEETPIETKHVDHARKVVTLDEATTSDPDRGHERDEPLPPVVEKPKDEKSEKKINKKEEETEKKETPKKKKEDDTTEFDEAKAAEVESQKKENAKPRIPEKKEVEEDVDVAKVLDHVEEEIEKITTKKKKFQETVKKKLSN
jgi:segregation and condensation protein B